jgi:hypothetical protein
MAIGDAAGPGLPILESDIPQNVEIPQNDGVILTAGHQHFAIRTEGYSRRPISVTLQESDEM